VLKSYFNVTNILLKIYLQNNLCRKKSNQLLYYVLFIVVSKYYTMYVIHPTLISFVD